MSLWQKEKQSSLTLRNAWELKVEAGVKYVLIKNK